MSLKIKIFSAKDAKENVKNFKNKKDEKRKKAFLKYQKEILKSINGLSQRGNNSIYIDSHYSYNRYSYLFSEFEIRDFLESLGFHVSYMGYDRGYLVSWKEE